VVELGFNFGYIEFEKRFAIANNGLYSYNLIKSFVVCPNLA